MERIILFKEERPDIKISMEIYFNEKGQLIFDGYDIGKTVKDWWGDSDYEYACTIEAAEVEKQYSLFGVEKSDQNSHLLAIKRRFEGNKRI
jgi:hypothetical protein